MNRNVHGVGEIRARTGGAADEERRCRQDRLNRDAWSAAVVQGDRECLRRREIAADDAGEIAVAVGCRGLEGNGGGIDDIVRDGAEDLDVNIVLQIGRGGARWREGGGCGVDQGASNLEVAGTDEIGDVAVQFRQYRTAAVLGHAGRDQFAGERIIVAAGRHIDTVCQNQGGRRKCRGGGSDRHARHGEAGIARVVADRSAQAQGAGAGAELSDDDGGGGQCVAGQRRGGEYRHPLAIGQALSGRRDGRAAAVVHCQPVQGECLRHRVQIAQRAGDAHGTAPGADARLEVDA